jgi:hypothetical protein
MPLLSERRQGLPGPLGSGVPKGAAGDAASWNVTEGRLVHTPGGEWRLVHRKIWQAMPGHLPPLIGSM